MKSELFITGMVLALTVATGTTGNIPKRELGTPLNTGRHIEAACNGYTDENHDGVCDNRDSHAGQNICNGYTDENHDGICDNGDSHAGQNICNGYADENHDGVCDNGDVHAEHHQNTGNQGYAHQSSRHINGRGSSHENRHGRGHH